MHKFLPILVRSFKFTVRRKDKKSTNYQLPTHNPFGFTLVELLIAITILAILSVIGFTVFTGIQKDARDTKRKADINAMAAAMEAHYNSAVDKGCTPGVVGAYCKPLDSALWFSSGKIPKDPGNNSSYALTEGDGASPFDGGEKSFKVCATLEAGATYCRSNQQ